MGSEMCIRDRGNLTTAPGTVRPVPAGLNEAILTLVAYKELVRTNIRFDGDEWFGNGFFGEVPGQNSKFINGCVAVFVLSAATDRKQQRQRHWQYSLRALIA